MKRTPLKRVTALVSKKPIPRGAGGMARTSRLKPRSDKMAKLYREERVPLVVRLLAERPWCQAQLDGCTKRSSEIHEVLSRGRGGSITDESNCRALCHQCHQWITEHPKEAHELGFLRHSWEAEAS